MSQKINKSFNYFLEIAKWGIVVWLLWPMLTFQAERMSVWRLVFGVMMAVIFVGKMFYDFILDNFKARRERYTIVDLLLLVGFIAIVAVLIGGTIVLVGLYLVTQMQEAAADR